MSVWAVLVAAGRGERLGVDRPEGVRAARRAACCSRSRSSGSTSATGSTAIVVVAPPGWEEPTILLAEELGAAKVTACVPGGDERPASVRAGARRGARDAAVILVHDAARPLLPPSVVGRAARRRSTTAGTAPSRACRSRTRSSASRGGVVEETLPRDELVAVQTPQAFVADALRARWRARRRARLRRAGRGGGGRVKVVEGDQRLLKVTTPPISRAPRRCWLQK